MADRLQHEGAKRFRTAEDMESASQGRAPVTDGEAEERFFPGEIRDDFYLSPDDRRRYGIENAVPSSLADTAMEGTRVIVAIRAPESRLGRLQPGHFRGKRRARQSMEIVRDEHGEPVMATDDLIFATVDRANYLQSLERHNAATTEFTKGVITGRVETGEAANGFVESFRGSDERFLMRKKDETHAQLAGMKDKWPRGMSIEEIEKYVGVERTKQIERKYARNGRTERPGEYEEHENRLRERSKAAASAGKNKSFSFPGQATK